MINLDEGIEYPFSYGEQSMMKLALLDTILKKSGTFKINPGLKNDEFFRAVLNSYVHALLKNDQLVELFLEARRSRSGKIQHPNNDQIFDMIVANHLKTQGRTKELFFVPITINYDRVVEGEVFPHDLLGEKPVKESFLRSVKQMLNIKKGMGKVVVQYGAPQPISKHLEAFANKRGLAPTAVSKDP